VAEIKVLSDKRIGHGFYSRKQADVRRLELEITGIGSTLVDVTPPLSGAALLGFAVTVKNTNPAPGTALSVLDLYYGLTEEEPNVAGPLDDSRDHWEKETGFSNLAAEAVSYAHFSHEPPTWFVLRAKTASGTAGLLLTLDLELK